MKMDELTKSFRDDIVPRVRKLRAAHASLKAADGDQELRVPMHLSATHFEEVADAAAATPVEQGTIERMMPCAIKELRTALKLQPSLDTETDHLLEVANEWLESFGKRDMGPAETPLREALATTLRAVARGEKVPRAQIVGAEITERKTVPEDLSCFDKAENIALILAKRKELVFRSPNASLFDETADDILAYLASKAEKKRGGKKSQSFVLPDGTAVKSSRFSSDYQPAVSLTVGVLELRFESKTSALDDAKL